MRILTGFIPFDSGSVTINGMNIQDNRMDILNRIGYLPEFPPLYPTLSVKQYLQFVAGIKKIPRTQLRHAVSTTIELAGLQKVADRIISKLSKGYRQRVGVAQTLLNNPDVLILDEPSTALDPEQRHDFRQLIADIAKERTVILSTHMLSEVSKVCDHIMILNHGQLLAQDNMAHLLSEFEHYTIVLAETEQVEDVRVSIQQKFGLEDVIVHQTHPFLELELIHNGSDDIRPQVTTWCVEQSLPVYEVRRECKSLESRYLQLIHEAERKK
jgi:ABC-2 type transport system ATP-binding protein